MQFDFSLYLFCVLNLRRMLDSHALDFPTVGFQQCVTTELLVLVCPTCLMHKLFSICGGLDTSRINCVARKSFEHLKFPLHDDMDGALATSLIFNFIFIYRKFE